MTESQKDDIPEAKSGNRGRLRFRVNAENIPYIILAFPVPVGRSSYYLHERRNDRLFPHSVGRHERPCYTTSRHANFSMSQHERTTVSSK